MLCLGKMVVGYDPFCFVTTTNFDLVALTFNLSNLLAL